MSKLKSVSLYDVYKLEGEDKAMAVKTMLSMSEAVNLLGETYLGFADNAQNAKTLEEERLIYIEEEKKRDEEFNITVAAYTFLRFTATLEHKLSDILNNINTKENEK